jgi:hypothetical protein
MLGVCATRCQTAAGIAVPTRLNPESATKRKVLGLVLLSRFFASNRPVLTYALSWRVTSKSATIRPEPSARVIRAAASVKC